MYTYIYIYVYTRSPAPGFQFRGHEWGLISGGSVMPMGCRSRGAFGGRSKTYPDRAPPACSMATSGVAASSLSPATPQEMALQDRVRPDERRKEGWDGGACKTARGGDRGVTQLVGLLPDTAVRCRVVTHSRRVTPLAAFWQHLALLPLGAASGHRRRSSSRCLGTSSPYVVLMGGFRTDWGPPHGVLRRRTRSLGRRVTRGARRPWLAATT